MVRLPWVRITQVHWYGTVDRPNLDVCRAGTDGSTARTLLAAAGRRQDVEAGELSSAALLEDRAGRADDGGATDFDHRSIPPRASGIWGRLLD